MWYDAYRRLRLERESDFAGLHKQSVIASFPLCNQLSLPDARYVDTATTGLLSTPRRRRRTAQWRTCRRACRWPDVATRASRWGLHAIDGSTPTDAASASGQRASTTARASRCV
jgi:hypothetical protein